MNTLSTASLLPYIMLKGVGPAALRRVLEAARSGIRLDIAASYIPPVAKALQVKGAWEAAQDRAQQQLEQAAKHESRILSPVDAEYPRLLRASKDDPFFLYVKGQLRSTVDAPPIAVIGTREPTRHGALICERITHYLVGQRASVVSGLAMGCDSIAHRACLSAGGHTIAVLAHGLQTIAPPQHLQLAEEIVAGGGALVTEYPFGTDVRPQQFVRRDHTQAGLALGVVMIQSGLDGGSLHASRAALTYGRWLAAPYPTDADAAASEANVQANILLGSEDHAARCALLRCELAALERVYLLRGREDYRVFDSLLVGSHESSL